MVDRFDVDADEGKRVSRRTLVLGGLTLAGVLAACGDSSDAAPDAAVPSVAAGTDPVTLLAGAGTCGLSPTTTQGPYYFDPDKLRGDVREDRPGTRLDLALKVVDSESCGPLKDLVVEIWHCDAKGRYSGAEKLSASGFGSMGGSMPSGMPMPTGMMMPGSSGDMADLTPQDDTRYLRGAQVSDAQGVVRFTTVWPGWYTGRTVHIHVMVHVNNTKALVTQLMFDEKLNNKVFAVAPYASHLGRDTTNAKDTIFKNDMLMGVKAAGTGYIAAKTLGVDVDKNGR
ncbi:intradiol ring-cleavage dioxygenase [Actinokineospora auranticolor]|uniref:Protocatechuate 3,4-dioxygenase beta subunit n=1 Tax=Actinokineospora auranticolor TaxID=155976 RepID=A0A2S6GQJ9_9PSEU|nr:intradiol ring-cleavage dioxygenase [Actinokineospora auranticolor]PPK67470.1 hypothetical protein CLV40_107134 [Actinokineospora auranticolor]